MPSATTPAPPRAPLAMLHSGRHHPRWAARSLTALMAGGLTHAEGQTRRLGDWPPERGQAPAWSHNPFEDLEQALIMDPGVPWVGYLSYDLARQIERLPTRAADDRRWPLLRFHRCPDAHWQTEPASLPLGPEGSPPPFFSSTTPQPLRPRAAHEAAVRRALDYIGAGDIFQVNLAQRFSADFTGDPRAAFARLAQVSPAWYGGYLEFPPAGPGEPWRALASTSPELFLELTPEGRVTTRPIKGTRPAHVAADALAASAKDAAELHMIVDLMRNDLGRVCRYGSVRVDESRRIESHPTVHHGVATVSGQLRPDSSLADLLRATLPGGSITGAPKVRAMEIIEELEPVRRGPYCGAFGWLQADAKGRIAGTLAMTIRTLLFEKESAGAAGGRVDFSVGGGIVADSEPALEWQETLDKAAAMREVLGGGGPGCRP